MRQRELGLAQAYRRSVRLHVRLAAVVQPAPGDLVPLMVLDPASLPSGPRVRADRVADVSPPTVPPVFAVAWLASVSRYVLAGSPGTRERDAATHPLSWILGAGRLRDGAGHKAEAVVTTRPAGIVARGVFESALGAAEIVGALRCCCSAAIAGLWGGGSARRWPAGDGRGNDIVFLSVASEDVDGAHGLVRWIGTAAPRDAARTP